MLEVAGVKPGETVYDLGCGDGRVLITAVQKFGAKAVGVELSDALAKAAEDNIKKHKIESQARVIHANMLDVDLSPADVVILYLMTSSNELLRPILEKQLKPGARVVSHDFEVRGWTPVAKEQTDFLNKPHMIYLYEIPRKK
jgi:predicted RNA methylase